MNQGLLVVDVQPAFDNSCHVVAESVASRINNSNNPVVVMWVGEGLTDDTEESVREYLHSYGAKKNKLAEARFVEKHYGFFRPWMDSGVDRDVTVSVGKYLLSQDLSDSEKAADWLSESELELPDDKIGLPQFDSSAVLAFDSLETCGGGSYECLEEIEIWLDIHEKQYQRLHHLSY